MSLSCPVVFPLHPIVNGACACGFAGCTRIGKHPAVLWRELKIGDSVPRPEPGAGVGIRTGVAPKGSNVVVVDLDGPDAFKAWEALGGSEETYTVETGREYGLQLYFLPDPSVVARNSRGELWHNGLKGAEAQGIDVRGEGGFVVAPGSPHRSGKTYSVFVDAPIASMPPWLIDWLRTRKAPQETQAYAGDVEGEERDRRVALYRQYLETAPPSVQGQGGDLALFKVVQHGAYDLALPAADVLAAVEEVFDPRCDPPWGDELEERVLHKVESAKTSSTRPANTPLPADLEHLATGGPAPAGFVYGEPAAAVPVPVSRGTGGSLGFDFDDWEDEPPPIEFLVSGLVPRGCVGMLFGHGDSLKTWILFSLGIAVAKGEPWLGFPTTRGRVGLVDYETGKHNMRRRLYMLRAGKLGGQLAKKSFASLKPNDRDFWVALAKEDFDLVVVDSLRRANPAANENDSAEAIVPLELAAEFSELTGCAVLFIHHAKKSSDDGWPDPRGSAAITDQVDISYAVRKADISPLKKRVEIRNVKPGDMPMPLPFAVDVTFDDVERTTTLQLAAADSAEHTGDIRGAILGLLARGAQGSKDGIASILRKDKRRVRDEIDDLVAKRQVVSLPGKGFVLDSAGARRARIEAATATPGMSAPGKLARAAHVDEDEINELLTAGSLLRSGSGFLFVRSS